MGAGVERVNFEFFSKSLRGGPTDGRPLLVGSGKHAW